ncbi:MFS transporter [Streptomyces albidoflavus]|uniref:MFS transporter n=1 Tax=Streptomyces albidoflavus TaxID=1886 RepID=UPI0033FFBEE4
MSDATTGYRAALTVPRAKTVLGLGIASRLPSGLLPFTTLIVFTQRHNIAIAGLASAALLLTIAIPGPARARWCARRGPAAIGLLALASAALFTAAAFTLSVDIWQIPLALIAAAGALFPPLTPNLRAVWSRLMPDKQRLQSIHALDSTVEELTFVVTPLLATAAMAVTNARWVLIASALLLLPAAVGLSKILTDLPAIEKGQEPPGRAEHTKQRSIIRTRAGRGITVPVIALGLCGGGLTIIIPAATVEFADVISSGYGFAAFSLGGLVGGLAYGRVKWAAALRVRYVAATVSLMVGALLLAAAAASPLSILAVFCVGLPMTPIFVIAYLLVDEYVDPSRHPEANAWLGSGYNLGSATGSAAGGQLLALAGPRGLAVTLAGISFVATLIAHRLPRTATTIESVTAFAAEQDEDADGQASRT